MYEKCFLFSNIFFLKYQLLRRWGCAAAICCRNAGIYICLAKLIFNPSWYSAWRGWFVWFSKRNNKFHHIYIY